MRLRPIKVRKMMRLLEKFGYRLIRVTGSHYIYKKEGKGLIPIPKHGEEEICPSLLSKMVRELGIDRKTFLEKLNEI